MTHLKDNIYFELFEHRGKMRRRYKIKTTCGYCGNSIFADRANAQKSKRSFCNIECKGKGQSGSGAPNWVGGKKNKQGKKGGYILIHAPEHPAAKKGFVPEHRLVVEKRLGRFLLPEELVHHVDCDKRNNLYGNLDICSILQHVNAHNSLEKCVKALLKLGVLKYDFERKIYFVPHS